MPAVGLEPEWPLLGLFLTQVVASRPFVACRCRLLRGGRGQRLEPLFLVDMKTVVREADRFDLGFGGNVTEQLVENAAPRFSRRLGAGAGGSGAGG